MPHDNATEDDAALVLKVYEEYCEMPGLQLTLRQASRLWGLSPGTCARVLARLVDDSLLRRDGDRYVLAESARCCV